MKVALKAFAVVAGMLFLIVGGVYAWASVASGRILSRTYEAHVIDFPIPFPLTQEEAAAAGVSGEDAERLALERAIERGRHLVESRYACIECHGQDFGGGVMVDAPPIGRILGPNITTGRGSRTLGYTPADWDRIVRHGILPDSTPAAMPSEDFQLMSDRELSDIVAYLRSKPPVDNEVPEPALGPLGKFLIATGDMPLSADVIESHDSTHRRFAPAAEVSVEFGRHMAGICTSCHRQNLAGGPIPGGDPSWAPARNITPHEDGLAGWTYEDFRRAMTEGRRPDGTDVLLPMTLVLPYAQRMTDVEMQALWAYLQSVPPAPSPE